MFKSWISTCGCLAALSVCAGEFPADWTFDKTPEARARHEALEGKPMPPLSVTGWVNGQVNAADVKGKVVVVDFYATWCGPCMAAIPHNNELLTKYKDKGLVLFGVCTSAQGQERMPQTVSERGIQYPTARDPQLKSQTAYQVHFYPTYAIIDRKGIVRIIGAKTHRVEEIVKKLLDEPQA